MHFHRLDNADYPTALLVLDGCDIVLPALGMFVLNIVQSFPGVQVPQCVLVLSKAAPYSQVCAQILLTSTEELQIDTGEDAILPEEVVHVGELGKLDSAKLFSN